MSEAIQALTGGSSAKQSSRPVDVTPNDVAALRGTFGSALTNLINQGGPQQYSGPLVAPVDQAQQTALGAVSNAAYNPQTQAYLNQSLAGNFLPGQPGSNPYTQAAITAAQRPTVQALNDTLARTLPGVFTAAGQQIGGGLRSNNGTARPGSTAFDMAAARAFEGGSNALGDIATNFMNTQYGQERQLQQQSVQLQQQQVQSLINNLTAQSLPQQIADLGVQRGLDLYKQNVTALLQALQTATGAGGLVNIGNQSQGTSTTYKGIVPALLPKGLQGG
jgi:hypothetical protein